MMPSVPPDRHAEPCATPPSRWLADGVRHQIVLRALRGQRHDVLGPLSAARMQVATLRRRAAAVVADPQAVQAQAEALSHQLAEAVAAVALMRVWDGPASDTLPAASLLAACVGLLGTDASLHGHRLGAAAPAEPETLPRVVGTTDGHYALLGCLMHLLDAADGPLDIQVRLVPGAFELRSEALPQSPAVSLAPPAAPPRAIDATALAALLADLGWQLHRIDPQTARLAWPQR